MILFVCIHVHTYFMRLPMMCIYIHCVSAYCLLVYIHVCMYVGMYIGMQCSHVCTMYVCKVYPMSQPSVPDVASG